MTRPWQLDPERLARRIKAVHVYWPFVLVIFKPEEKIGWLLGIRNVAYVWWHRWDHAVFFLPRWRWGIDPTEK